MGLKIIDESLNDLSILTGISYSEWNLFMCMIFTFPIGYINRFIKNSNYRLIYGLVTGILLQMQMYGLEILHVIFATLFTYLFIQYFGRKVSAFYVLIFNICHLSYFHLDKMFRSYAKWQLGIDALYMMSICKFSSVVFNYEDGGKDEKEIQSSYHREKVLKEKPTLLEIASFIFYFPSSLIGPSFEFKDFIKYINLEDEYENINLKLANWETLKEISITFLIVALKIFLGQLFSIQYCGSKEFIEHNIVFKFFYVLLATLLMKSTYYVGWKISQASVIFCGLSYKKTYSTHHLDHKIIITHESMYKIDTCNLMKIELDVNPRVRIQYWNRSVHLWLKYYVFLRLINIDRKPFKNNKALASLLTFMVSAWWHGFYLVYYIFFFEYYMIEQISTYFEEEYHLFDIIRNWRFFPKLIYRIFILFVLNYFGLSFSILTLEGNFNYFKAFHYVPLAGLIICWIWTKFAKKTRKVKSTGKED